MSQEYEAAKLVIKEVSKAVIGKDECVKKAYAAILAGGHILIEDVPGVGKTTLAVAFSRALKLNNVREQFTPDVMPSDILGFNMYDKNSGTFKYQPGAVMCNLFLADEINRASPKTQSALLEVMEEHKVTVDGVTRKLPEPFFVMATQNPKGSAGTQLLPESQLDRFMICMSMGYPDLKNEIAIAKGRSEGVLTENVQGIGDARTLAAMINKVSSIYIHNNIYTYIAKLVQATRDNPYIELGVSPRGTISLAQMSKAWAFLSGREYVIPKDVEDVFLDTTKHRIVLNTKAKVAHLSPETVLEEVLKSVKQPASYMERANGRA